jgi:hypothetical protein
MGHSSIQVTVDIYGHLVPVETGRPSTGWTIRRRQRKSRPQQRKSERVETKVETIGENFRFGVAKMLKSLARPEGFEPPTLRSEV